MWLVGDYCSLRWEDGLYVLISRLTRLRAKPNSSTTITTTQSGTERSTQTRVVPHFAKREGEGFWG